MNMNNKDEGECWSPSIPSCTILCLIFKECLDNLDYQPDNLKDSLDLVQHIYSFLW